MTDSLLLGLQYHSKVEVYYSLEAEDSGRKQVWWPAFVEKINLIRDYRGSTMTASLKFMAMSGFRSVTKSFTFEGDQQIRDKDNISYSWRMAPTQSDSIESSSPQSDDAHGDQDYLPGGQSEVVPMEETGTVDVRDNRLLDSLQLKRKYADMERSIQHLRKVVEHNTGLLSDVRTDVDHIRHSKSYPDGPLKFLRSRIKPLLDRPLQVSRQSAESQGGLQYFSQDSMKRTCDCTLLQFDEIAEYIHGRSELCARFIPPYREFKAYPQSEVRIVFNSFKSLATVFAPISPRLLREAVIKTKLERGTGVMTAVRVLGCAIQNACQSTRPMYLLVGEGLPSTSPHDPQRENSKKQVICRDSMTWNDVEGMFDSPLHIKEMTSSDLERVFEPMLTAEELETFQHKYSFSLVWRRDVNNDIESYLTPQPPAQNILGLLEVTIPFALIRDYPHSRDISHILTNFRL